MVRRIKTCSSCQRRYASTSSTVTVCKICEATKEELENVDHVARVQKYVSLRSLDHTVESTSNPAPTSTVVTPPALQSEMATPLNCLNMKGDWESFTLGSLVTAPASSASLRPAASISSDTHTDGLEAASLPKAGDSVGPPIENLEEPLCLSSKVACSVIGVDVVDSVCEEQNMRKKPKTAAMTTEADTTEDKTRAIHVDNDMVQKDLSPSSSQLQKDICFICGSSLDKISTFKGRLNHIKRCSKNNGVTARTVKTNDDSEEFVNDDLKPARTVNATSNKGNNPYDKSSWHGDAIQDLALAEEVGCSEPSTVAAAYESKGPQQQQTSMKNFFKAPIRSLNSVLLAGAKRAAKTAELVSLQKENNVSKGKKRRRSWGGYSSNRTCPSYKRIPGTDFVCDGFLYAKSAATKNFFLTHFHSDHYGGISKSWKGGTIYCSLPTANLVHEKLGVDRRYLHPLGMNTPTVIETTGNKPVVVTLLDANHCPGAVMFLFEVGRRKILHVGDFRWNQHVMLQSSSPLRPFSSSKLRLDELFLDTTYCDERYCFPTQDEAICAAVDIAEKEIKRFPRALLLFGAYTIGKERIYLSVAERLRKKVYVDKQRYQTLSALNWSKEKMTRLTTDKSETCLWVVPLGHINFKHMKDYFDQASKNKVFQSPYDRIIGFRPTGWSKTSGGKTVNTKSNGRYTVHGIPYSEHSSFTELVDCIACLKPKKIVPTVSVSKSDEQVELLLSALNKRRQVDF